MVNPPGGPLHGAFASLGYRNYLYLWLAQVTHSGALWLEMVARPLLVLDMTGSAVHLGLVMAVRTVPSMAFGPVAGVVADSFNRRTVMLATKAIVFGFSALFLLLMVADWLELWHVYLFTFLRGATMAFDQPARRAIIPSMVPRHLVTNAMALSSGSVQVMRIGGTAGAGLLIAFWHIPAAFAAISVCYAAAVVLTWQLRTPDHERRGYQGFGAFGTDLLEGLRFAWGHTVIRGIFMASVGYFTFGQAFTMVFAPLFAKQVLEIGDSGFGYMMAVTGLGGVAGALVLAAVNPGRRRGVLALAMLLVLGTLQVLFSASTYLGSVAVVFLVAPLMGAGQSGFMPVANAVIVEAAPERMRGRVVGLLSLDRAMAALGGALAGFLAAAIGPQVAQIAFGLACVATAVAMFGLYPPIRRID